MVERLPSDAELDALIEAALREDVVLPAPPDLQGKVLERVQVAALQARERARFRNTLLSGFAASAGIVAALGMLVVLTNFDVLLKHGVSGGQGLIDYYAATFELPWPGRVSGFTFALIAGLGAATAWAGLMPLRWRQGVQWANAGRAVDQAGQSPL